MVEALGRCAICGNPITAQFWFCADCEARYGLEKPMEAWPEWAVGIVTQFMAQRRAESDDLDNLDDSSEAASIYDRLCYGESE